MRFFLFRGLIGGGVPAVNELLERADIDIPVMKKTVERWHVLAEETPVLADGIAAKWGGLRMAVKFEEGKGHLFRFFETDPRGPAARGESRPAVLVLRPGVHGTQNAVRLL